MDKVILSNIIEIISGGTPKTTESSYWENGTIGWLSINDFNGGTRRVYHSEKHITELGVKNSSTTILQIDDIIISARGTVGELSQIGTPMAFNQSCFGIRGRKGIVDNTYLYYSLKNYVENIVKRSQGSVFNTINRASFDLMEINIHKSIKLQQKIAAVLSALDDKIELNNQINAELEAMAKALYDYWFVQFDFPNAEGKPYKSSRGKMVYNKVLKREIPEGWEVKSLYQIAKFINGLACQKFKPENEDDHFLPVIKIREMNVGISKNTEKVRVDIPKKNIIDDGDVLFSWSATLDVKIWTEGKAALNQHIFKVISEKYPRSFYYFETLNYLQHFKMMAELRKTTMGHITIDHLKDSYIPIPPIEIINALDDKLKPILERIITNKKQNQELAQLRDWLLPMLMNGQVTVGDVEEMGMVAEASLPYNRLEEQTQNWYDHRFEIWVSQQGLAARGTLDKATLRELFDAMNDEDK